MTINPENIPEVPRELRFPALATAMMAVAYVAERRVYPDWTRWNQKQSNVVPLGPPPSRRAMQSLVGVLLAMAIHNMSDEELDYMKFLEVLEQGGLKDE